MDSEQRRLREAVRLLRNEVNCRIEHGAESGGHLEYVQGQLDAALATPDAAPRSGECVECGGRRVVAEYMGGHFVAMEDCEKCVPDPDASPDYATEEGARGSASADAEACEPSGFQAPAPPSSLSPDYAQEAREIAGPCADAGRQGGECLDVFPKEAENWCDWCDETHDITHLAQRVARETREACAKELQELAEFHDRRADLTPKGTKRTKRDRFRHGAYMACLQAANAIRAAHGEASPSIPECGEHEPHCNGGAYCCCVNCCPDCQGGE